MPTVLTSAYVHQRAAVPASLPRVLRHDRHDRRHRHFATRHANPNNAAIRAYTPQAFLSLLPPLFATSPIKLS